jgi:type I restriction-modification system DNA methylase subunit
LHFIFYQLSCLPEINKIKIKNTGVFYLSNDMSEGNTDFFIGGLLQKSGIGFDYQHSGIIEIQEALKTSSKSGSGNIGHPEFIAKVGDFILVVENKKDISKQAKYLDNALAEDINSIKNYAENGALHYARNILKKTGFKKIFAFGCSGDKIHHIIRPIYVDESEYKLLKEVDNFTNFSEQNIDKYYSEQVLGKTPQEFKELSEILGKTKELHEYLRNYGQLGDSEKPLVVSAILLALDDNKNLVNTLNGDKIDTDGKKIYNALSTRLERINVQPETKKQVILNQFTIIKDRKILNDIETRLEKTPLRYFAEFLDKHVMLSIKDNPPEDVLGRFYGEFVRYGGGDGQTLGVVLTPRHITELFCDLTDIKPTDIVFDPCCGTGGFLVAAMHRMLAKATSDKQKRNIKKEQIHGIEIREDMFSIATTNMILRGDGKSNLLCDDFLKQPTKELQKKKFTVGLMNPPYSQSKGKDTAHLSEIKFIEHLLDSMTEGGRVAVIVPQSTMVGKTRKDKIIKADILKKHRLEGVITQNKETFHGVGTNPCIAIFTAYVPHPTDYRCKFINFEDDGFRVDKHIGLVETQRALERRKHLLSCWRGEIDTETKFMVKTKIEAEDEWLHSFYYFNDEIPKKEEFEKTMADYLTFEFNMITHGRGYLFGLEEESDGE